LPPEQLINGIRVLRQRAYPDVDDYYLAPGVYKTLRRGAGNWDLVHIQGSHTFVPPLAMLACRKARLPYVITFHTGTHSSRLRTVSRPLQWMLLRRLFLRARRYVAVSRFEQEYFSNQVGLPSSRFEYIPNGSDLPQPTISGEAQRQTLVLSVGRLERYKGHQRVIAAMPSLLELRPDARLLILGAGPYEGELRQFADRLCVADRVDIRTIAADDRQGMADTLASASLVVLMSDGESHPVAVMEALAMRRPVLGAHTQGLIELAERGWIRTVPLGSSPSSVAAAMLQQMDDPLVPEQVRLPTWDDCANALLRVYRDVARSSTCAS